MNGLVILNYNSWIATSQLAIKVSSMKIIDKIIIVDNKSSDESYSRLSFLENKKIHVIEAEKNYGYSYGNNIGIKYLVNNYSNLKNIFICNPDVIVDANCFTEMIFALNNLKEYGMVGAVRTDIEGNYSQRQFWSLPDFKTEIFDCFAIARFIRKKRQIYRFDEKLSGVYEVDVLPGSFWGARVDLLKSIDYLDEGTFLYYEENIISQRIHNAGYKQGIVLSAKYIHNHINKSPSHFNDIYKPFLNMQKSRKYYQNKYLDLNHIQRLILSICMELNNFEMFCICIIKLLCNKIK